MIAISLATSPPAAAQPSTRLRSARAICAWLPPLVAQRVRDVIYPRSVGRREDYAFTVRSATGSRFTGRTSDFVSYPVSVHGYFNWRNVAIARAVCRTGDVIVEVGANVGTETVAFSDIVGATGRVYAFEPFAPNLEHLELNAAQTTHRNVTILPVALSDREGEIRFAVPPGHNSGIGHLVDGGEASGDESVVQTTTLDHLGGELGAPRLVVIDAEGGEGAILAGASAFLEMHHPVLVLEVIGELLRRAGSSPELIATQLGELGYDLFEIHRLALEPIDVAGPIPQASDWIAIPKPSRETIERVRRTIRRAALLPCVPALNPLKKP